MVENPYSSPMFLEKTILSTQKVSSIPEWKAALDMMDIGYTDPQWNPAFSTSAYKTTYIGPYGNIVGMMTMQEGLGARSYLAIPFDGRGNDWVVDIKEMIATYVQSRDDDPVSYYADTRREGHGTPEYILSIRHPDASSDSGYGAWDVLASVDGDAKHALSGMRGGVYQSTQYTFFEKFGVALHAGDEVMFMFDHSVLLDVQRSFVEYVGIGEEPKGLRREYAEEEVIVEDKVFDLKDVTTIAQYRTTVTDYQAAHPGVFTDDIVQLVNRLGYYGSYGGLGHGIMSWTIPEGYDTILWATGNAHSRGTVVVKLNDTVLWTYVRNTKTVGTRSNPCTPGDVFSIQEFETVIRYDTRVTLHGSGAPLL